MTTSTEKLRETTVNQTGDGFILNEDEVNDWNYYGLNGNLITEDTVKPLMIGGRQKKQQNSAKRIEDYESFKRNLVVENLCDDRFYKEKRQENQEEEERKKKEFELIESRRQIELEKERKMEEQREFEKQYKLMKGAQKIRVEMDIHKSMKEKYGQGIDPEKGTKFSLYDHTFDKNDKSSLNITVEGIDLTKRGDPLYSKSNVNQPYNIVGDKVGIQKSNVKQSKASSVGTSKNKNARDNSNLDLDISSEDARVKNNQKINLFNTSISKKIPNQTKSVKPDIRQKNIVAQPFNEFLNEMLEFEDNNFVNPPQKQVESNISTKDALRRQLNKKPEGKIKNQPVSATATSVEAERKKETSKVIGNVPFGEEGTMTMMLKNESNVKQESSNKPKIFDSKSKAIHSHTTLMNHPNVEEPRPRDVSPSNIKSSATLKNTDKGLRVESESQQKKNQSLRKESKPSPEKTSNAKLSGNNVVVMDDD
jgi:hypothetical protein